MHANIFSKSDTGAQAAWKGFSSQTIYIASRIITDEDGSEYYPEDIEDLVIKKRGMVTEAVQIKNLTAELTLSDLAASQTSRGGEGFFRRMCSLHSLNPGFHCVRIVHFGALGSELYGIQQGNGEIKKWVLRRLKERHGLTEEEADWLLDALCFEKADTEKLNANILAQIKTYVQVMCAPDLAKDLLIQYVSRLSGSKGFTTLKMWQEQMHAIGVSIAAMDGFYKEYHKSLVRLSELRLQSSVEELQKEFGQGVSAHPEHIRRNLDFRRSYWMDMIYKKLEEQRAVVVKGVSGQGKSALSYRYLMDAYPEECVFCVRAIAAEEQAQNLAAALEGLGKHNKELIIYIDVQPGETLWAFLLQELQARGVEIPVLISIRDEDYNVTPMNGKSIQYEVVELALSKNEAEYIYDELTKIRPHFAHRTFEEAWQVFGAQGPLIEFMYLLTNNHTLKQRLQNQLEALLLERIPDEWLELLQIVCYAGRLGCSVNIKSLKSTVPCASVQAAVRRLKDEYLLRMVGKDKLEAMHPVRAQIVFDILKSQIYTDMQTITFKTLSCVASKNVRIILLNYFSSEKYCLEDVLHFSRIEFYDWLGYADTVKTMLWLDAKRYVENNLDFIRDFIKRHGKAWLCFLPLDLSGIERAGELIADRMKEIPIFSKKEELQKTIDEVKACLTSVSVEYQATDCFIKNSVYPRTLPETDEERSAFGYSLFWIGKRKTGINLPFSADDIAARICKGGLQASADAVRGLLEQKELEESGQISISIIAKRLISEWKLLSFKETEDTVACKFIPPMITEKTDSDEIKSVNHYWRMKLLNILKQIYPDKEYIDIKLIGVDLLRDQGIKAIDQKLHIHKRNRHDAWVTELNGWVKIRIDYSIRPLTWQQYVAEIDELRINSYELILATIQMLDDIYKKGRYTKARWKKVENRIKIFSVNIFAENRLPRVAVDPYCLYSEGQVNLPAAEYYTMRQLLSVKKYEKFRKSLNDVYTSLDNFYRQFAKVLLARIHKQNLDTIDNPKLAMFNLYAVAKALMGFQKEYDSLFARYSSLPEMFAQQETEAVLTLVNVWRHILDYPPRGQAIAYDARQRYRHGVNYFQDTLVKAAAAIHAEIVKTEKHAYLLAEYNMLEDRTLEQEYTDTVLKLKNVFTNAVLWNSDRWYVETQPLELAYVPVIRGVYFPVAYTIPFYKIFDTEKERIAKPMLLCEIETALAERMDSEETEKRWTNGIKKLSEIRVYLQRYWQIVQEEVDKKCIANLKEFLEEQIEQLRKIWNEFTSLEPLVKEAKKDAAGEKLELLKGMQIVFHSFDEIENCIKNQKNPEEIIQAIDIVSGIIMQLQCS